MADWKQTNSQQFECVFFKSNLNQIGYIVYITTNLKEYANFELW